MSVSRSNRKILQFASYLIVVISDAKVDTAVMCYQYKAISAKETNLVAEIQI